MYQRPAYIGRHFGRNNRSNTFRAPPAFVAANPFPRTHYTEGLRVPYSSIYYPSSNPYPPIDPYAYRRNPIYSEQPITSGPNITRRKRRAPPPIPTQLPSATIQLPPDPTGPPPPPPTPVNVSTSSILNEKEDILKKINDRLKKIARLHDRLPEDTDAPNIPELPKQNNSNFIERGQQFINWLELALIWYEYTVNDSNGTICLQYYDRNTKKSRLMRINEIEFDENNEFDIDFNELLIRANGVLAFKSIGKLEHLAPLRENNYYLIGENPCRNLPLNTSNQAQVPRHGTPAGINANRPGISGQLTPPNTTAAEEAERQRQLKLEEARAAAAAKAAAEQIAAIQRQIEEEATKRAALERQLKNAKNAAERKRLEEQQKQLEQRQRDLEKRQAALAAAEAKAKAEQLRLLEEARRRAKEDIMGRRRPSGSVSGLTTLSTISSRTTIPNSRIARRLARRPGSSGSSVPSTISSGNSNKPVNPNRPVNPTKRKRQTTVSGCRTWKCTRKSR